MLQIQNLTFQYKNREVLHDVTFEAEHGRIIAILAKNGTGKTTLFRLIGQTLSLQQGHILLNGSPVKRENICYLPEERCLFDHLSVQRHLEIIMDMKECREQMDYWVSRLHLGDVLHTQLRKLSKGNQQKCQIACCLCGRGEIVLMDEPFNGLDQYHKQLLENVIAEMKQQGKIILITSHQLAQIEDLADDFLYLEDGQIQQIISREMLVQDERKVLSVLCDDDFSFIDESILQEKEIHHGLRWIVSNAEAGYRILEQLKDDIQGFSIHPIGIGDIIGDQL